MLMFKLKNIDVANCNLIVAGDMNAVLDPNKDVIAGESHTKLVVNAFNHFVKSNKLIDIWRQQNDFIKQFTWKKTNPFMAKRLDYIFVNDNLSQKCKSTYIREYTRSDHCLVGLNVTLVDDIRGPGYWMFNASMLENESFKDIIIKTIKETEVKYMGMVNDQILWDICKVNIKHSASEFSKDLAKKRFCELELLERELENLNKKLSTNPTDRSLQINYDKTRRKLERVEMVKAKGAIILSKIKWIEEGEKNSAFFLSLEKTRAKMRVINKLVSKSGETLLSKSEILDEIYNYYAGLYAADPLCKPQNIYNFLKETPVPQLTVDEQNMCEGKFNEDECWNVIRNMKNESSPGLDGLGPEFYKYFWPNIKHLVVNSLNSAFINGKLSVSQRKGVIKLIHKESGMSRENLKNYRPISLTCCDYKIGAGVLAKRLQSVIGKLNSDQGAYIKGRGIHLNLRQIQDIIWFADVQKLQAAILAVDYSKAFDSISIELVIEALKKFNFGYEFIQWIKVFNTDRKSCVSNAGWHTRQFTLERGIRQGCPISALLFILASELLACKIRNMRCINGIQLPNSNKQIKISQYADDITIFVSDEASLKICLNLFDEFSVISGLQVNKTKTAIMGIGLWANVPELCQIHCMQKIKILGVIFPNKGNSAELDENWIGRLHKVSCMISHWNRRYLSLTGKIILVKSLFLSQFTHLFMIMKAPDSILKKLNSLMFKFIWQTGGKGVEKVKRKVLIQEIKYGGLNMVDAEIVNLSLITAWAKRLKEVSKIENVPNWARIPLWVLNGRGRDFLILKSNCKFNDLACDVSNIPLFYQLIIKTILDINNVKSEVNLSDIIWNNQNIKYQGKTLYFNQWIRDGVVYVSQIVKHLRLYSLQEIKRMVKDRGELLFQYIMLRDAMSKVVIQTSSKIGDMERFYNSRDIKSFLCVKVKSDPICQNMWKSKFKDTVFDWKHIWLNHCFALREAKINSLMWKIIHNIYTQLQCGYINWA